MTTCAVCSHPASVHQRAGSGVVCSHQACPCLCFIPDTFQDLPIEPVNRWESSALLGVVELLVSHKEGEVRVKTDDGRECLVKVTLRERISVLS